MGNGWSGIGEVPVSIRETGADGSLGVRSCWTRDCNYVELLIHDPARDRLYLLDLSIEDARQLVKLLQVAAPPEQSNCHELTDEVEL
jgi:hypothetical protein